MSANNLLTDWAWLLFDSLAKAGVTDIVISPGSRSTPFVLAAVAHGALRCHDIFDERAASFFALGQARVTGRPSVLVCTSGSAAAHYLPAVMEASASFTPLIVLTADRPLELQDCAAPQTTDQIKLYGSHARHFFDLGAPDAAASALRLPRRIAAQAVFAARWPIPGAVHINARARKPLEPQAADSDEGLRLHDQVRALAATPLTAPIAPLAAPAPDAIAALAQTCRARPRGLIVCGPAPLAQARQREHVFALAAATRYPILCEATSQLRFTGEAPRAGVVRCDGFDALLRARPFRDSVRPEIILQLGAAPTAGSWDQYLAAHAGCERVVIAPQGWNDPQSTAATLLFAEVGPAAQALAAAFGAAALPDERERLAWSRRFAAANQQGWRIVDEDLAKNSFAEAAVAREVAAQLPRDGLLFVGNSLAIRLVDSYAPAGKSDALVLSQRGVNGIDGLISGAAGAASASRRPTTLLLGDVSFLHDLNGLALARSLDLPFVVVVLQNGGGRIFEQLPLATTPGVTPELMEHMTTPHGLEFAHAAQLFGLGYERVHSLDSLRDALAVAQRAKRATLIEAMLAPHGAAEQHQRIGKALDSLATLVDDAR
jgi:2-succinyl-5-enolpyruvyl-6-hydroxy-3-cyclohexene-1-carboxylate synthase